MLPDLVFILVPARLPAVLRPGPELVLALRVRRRRGLHYRNAATLVIEDNEATKPLTQLLQELA